MIEISPVGVLVLGELLLGLTLVVLGLVVVTVIRGSRDRRAAATLIATVKAEEDARKQALRAILEDRYEYRGDQLEQAVRDINLKEKLLYQAVIGLYLRRDAAALAQLHIDVQALVEAYRALKSPRPAAVDDGAENNPELARLEEENQRLAEELRITMDSMARMLSEYSSMFGSGPQTGAEASKPSGSPADDAPAAGPDARSTNAAIASARVRGEVDSAPAAAEETADALISDGLLDSATAEGDGPGRPAEEPKIS